MRQRGLGGFPYERLPWCNCEKITCTHKCSCGCELQRDVNAAINILNLAKAREGHSRSNATGVGISTLVGKNLLDANFDDECRIPSLARRSRERLRAGECQGISPLPLISTCLRQIHQNDPNS